MSPRHRLSTDDRRTSTVVELSGATKVLGANQTVFEDVDLRIERGTSTAIVGTSGSGKTTLLSCIGLLDRVSAGEVIVQDRPTSRLPEHERDRLRATSIGFVFQRFFLLTHLSALENVEAAFLHGPKVSRHQSVEKAGAALEAVGLGALARRKPRQLSGGEQQRVAIARAIARSPDLILADEPTGSLDNNTGREIVDLLLRLVSERRSTLLVVTHDRSLAARLGRTLEISRGHLRSPNENG